MLSLLANFDLAIAGVLAVKRLMRRLAVWTGREFVDYAYGMLDEPTHQWPRSIDFPADACLQNTNISPSQILNRSNGSLGLAIANATNVAETGLNSWLDCWFLVRLINEFVRTCGLEADIQCADVGWYPS